MLICDCGTASSQCSTAMPVEVRGKSVAPGIEYAQGRYGLPGLPPLRQPGNLG